MTGYGLATKRVQRNSVLHELSLYSSSSVIIRLIHQVWMDHHLVHGRYVSIPERISHTFYICLPSRFVEHNLHTNVCVHRGRFQIPLVDYDILHKGEE